MDLASGSWCFLPFQPWCEAWFFAIVSLQKFQKKNGTQMAMKRPNSWLSWGSTPCSLAPSVCNTHGQRFPGFKEAHNFNTSAAWCCGEGFGTIWSDYCPTKEAIFEFWPIWNVEVLRQWCSSLRQILGANCAALGAGLGVDSGGFDSKAWTRKKNRSIPTNLI